MSASAPGKGSANDGKSQRPETAFQQQISVLFVSTYRKLVNGIVAMFIKGSNLTA